MVQIVPAILATTEKEYQEKLKKVNQSNLFEEGWVQIDLMDNIFVQNKSIGSEIIAKYPTKIKLEAQLMVKYPERWIDDLLKAGVKRVIFPVEDQESLELTIQALKEARIEIGLSLNPETGIKKVEKFVPQIDWVLVMSVNPGFGGQKFIESSQDKVKELRDKNWPIKIEVDGGITPEIAAKLVRIGADSLVIGSHLLEGNIEENLEKIWEAINYGS